jgi:two-component system response regulator
MDHQRTSNAAADPAANKSPLVLLIEDNDDHAELVRRALDMSGQRHELVRFEDGEQAIRYLLAADTAAANPSACALILLDLRLPRVDGLEVLRCLRQSQQTTAPIVVLTTSEAEADVAAAYESGAHAYVVKPTDFKSFGNLARDLAAFWLVWNKARSASYPR